jgi:hypothetical protein
MSSLPDKADPFSGVNFKGELYSAEFPLIQEAIENQSRILLYATG